VRISRTVLRGAGGEIPGLLTTHSPSRVFVRCNRYTVPGLAPGLAPLRAIKNIAIGLTCGVALAEPAMLLVNRLLATSPLPLHKFDLTVFGISAVLLAAVSLIALYLPAFRAMRTDPIRALRTE
jgi:hypothetical protein